MAGDWREIRIEDREDVKLWFRVGIVGFLGIGAFFFAVAPESWIHAPWTARAPAWGLIGAVIGNMFKGLLD